MVWAMSIEYKHLESVESTSQIYNETNETPLQSKNREREKDSKKNKNVIKCHAYSNIQNDYWAFNGKYWKAASTLSFLVQYKLWKSIEFEEHILVW